MTNPKERLEYLRGELRAERISYGELAELESLREHIEPGDVELLEAAGVPEHEEDRVNDDERFFIIESPNDENKISEVATAAGHPVVALCDEDHGGVIGYLHPAHADNIASGLNEVPEMP